LVVPLANPCQGLTVRGSVAPALSRPARCITRPMCLRTVSVYLCANLAVSLAVKPFIVLGAWAFR
jgi:hypothetical protein